MANIPEKLAWLSEAIIQLKEGPALSVTVIPKSSQNAIIGIRNGSLLVKVRVAPEKGKANQAVLELLSDTLGLPASSYKVIAGQTSRHKRILLPISLFE